MTRRTAELDLLIEQVNSHYRSRILGSEFGEAHQDFSLPYLEDEIEGPDGIDQHSRDLRRQVISRHRSPRDIGKRLFNAALGGDVGRIYHRCFDHAEANGYAVRLKLRLAEVPELSALPWETLLDPHREGEFLALSPHVSLVRYLDSSGRVQPWKNVSPLRVLAVGSSPIGLSRLDLEKEWKNLEQSFAPLVAAGGVQLDHLWPGTIEDLRERLKSDPPHVLHFMGHGTFDTRRGVGELILESRDGGAHALDAHRLATVLKPAGLQLIVLNICEGGKHSDHDTFSGVAQSLVRHGVPAVVAMQERIADQAAILFASTFYEALAANSSLEDALRMARHELYLKADPSWTLPMLFLQTPGRDQTLLASVLENVSEGSPPADSPPSPNLLVQSPVQSQRKPKILPILLLGGAVIAAGILLRGFLGRSDPRCPSPTGLDIEFVYFEGGEFEMGHDQPGEDELPKKVDQVADFCIGKYEVTVKQWQQLMPTEEISGPYPGPDHPVEVNFQEAQAFIDLLNSSNKGDGYSLPTEQEWEYAARAGTRTAYSFGDDELLIEEYGNCLSPSGADGFDRAAPVGSFRPNPAGLYDMHGNVREWVLPMDFPEKATSSDPASSPENAETQSGTEPAGSGALSATETQSKSEPVLVLRGGFYKNVAPLCQSATRKTVKRGDAEGSGFRIVYNPPTNDSEKRP